MSGSSDVDNGYRLDTPRLVLAGDQDNISYGPKWDDAYVPIGAAVSEHRPELIERGWTVELIPGADHLSAMRARTVLPVLSCWFTSLSLTSA